MQFSLLVSPLFLGEVCNRERQGNALLAGAFSAALGEAMLVGVTARRGEDDSGTESVIREAVMLREAVLTAHSDSKTPEPVEKPLCKKITPHLEKLV